jgi:two-component system nitrate/nitrite response regulator NarL
MIRLLHCDDSDSMRLLVREQFSGHARVEIVGEAADPEGAVHGAAEAQPDVVLLDLLDPMNAERLVADIRRAAPGARIVVYSGYPPETARIGHGGADGYVEKSAPFDVLERAIVG